MREGHRTERRGGCGRRRRAPSGLATLESTKRISSAMRSRVEAAGDTPCRRFDWLWFKSIYFRSPAACCSKYRDGRPRFRDGRGAGASRRIHSMLPPWLEPSAPASKSMLPPIASACRTDQWRTISASNMVPRARISDMHPDASLLHGNCAGSEHDLRPLDRVRWPRVPACSARGEGPGARHARVLQASFRRLFDLDDLRIRTHELASVRGGGGDALRVGSKLQPSRWKSLQRCQHRREHAPARTWCAGRCDLFSRDGPDRAGIPLPALVVVGLHVRWPHRPLIPCRRSDPPAVSRRQAGAIVDIEWKPGDTSLRVRNLAQAKRWWLNGGACDAREGPGLEHDHPHGTCGQVGPSSSRCLV